MASDNSYQPLSEENEKSLLVLLLKELNNLYPLNLGMDIVCDRFMEDNVFDDSTMDCMDPALIGASHQSTIAKHVIMTCGMSEI